MAASLAAMQQPQAGALNTVITVSCLFPVCFLGKWNTDEIIKLVCLFLIEGICDTD